MPKVLSLNCEVRMSMATEIICPSGHRHECSYFFMDKSKWYKCPTCGILFRPPSLGEWGMVYRKPFGNGREGYAPAKQVMNGSEIDKELLLWDIEVKQKAIAQVKKDKIIMARLMGER